MPSTRKWMQVGRRVLLFVLVLEIIVGAINIQIAQAATNVTLRLTIERVLDLNCIDSDIFGCHDADFYPVVYIDGEEFTHGEISDQGDISPNWEFSKQFDLDTKQFIPVQVNIWDSDGGLRFDDNHADLERQPNDPAVDLTIDLNACAIAGDVNGLCDATLTSAGTDDERAQIWFRVQVDFPPSAPGLRMLCIHDSIWPQPGDIVSFQAAAFDGTHNPKRAESIELFINDKTTPAQTGVGIRPVVATAGPFQDGTTIFYGCRVHADGQTIWSGWHTVQVGIPTAGQAVPVVLTGPSSSRIDIVFIADQYSYDSPLTMDFRKGVQAIIKDAYYSEDVFLRNQDKFNFWIALDRGKAGGTAQECQTLDPPDNWDDNYAFADSGAILHADEHRDCADHDERVFSTEANGLRVVLHETGHSPFGLADEYCRPDACDGGYFQNDPFPNVYAEPEDCIADIGSLQPFDVQLGLPPRTAGACREFEEDRFWFFDKDWSVSDPVSHDLMVDNQIPQGADVRRIEWVLDQCRSAHC